MVIPGLEAIAAQEIEEVLGGTIKRTEPGFVAFRLEEIDKSILRLRTVEDVFLLAWGTNQLTLQADDLNRIRRWTAHDADWNQLLKIHHAIRPRPSGRPTFHLVTQMAGEHGYRRGDAREALIHGLAGKLPASWRLVDEGAAVEVWLSIQDRTAICGLRLSDRDMRHRTYKLEHLPASLRPTLAAAMVRLAETKPGQVLLDPLCGAGSILAEQLARREKNIEIWGGDIDLRAIRAAEINLRRLGQAKLSRWDAGRLPLPDASVDRIVSNPPFGKQLSTPEEVGPLYRRLLPELARVLKPDGRAVLLVSETALLNEAARSVGWKSIRSFRLRILGQPATLSVWKN